MLATILCSGEVGASLTASEGRVDAPDTEGLPSPEGGAGGGERLTVLSAASPSPTGARVRPSTFEVGLRHVSVPSASLGLAKAPASVGLADPCVAGRLTLTVLNAGAPFAAGWIGLTDEGNTTTYFGVPLTIGGFLKSTSFTDKSFRVIPSTGGTHDRISHRTWAAALNALACFLERGSRGVN